MKNPEPLLFDKDGTRLKENFDPFRPGNSPEMPERPFQPPRKGKPPERKE